MQRPSETVTVRPAATAADFEEAAALMREFVEWHRARHTQDHELIGRYFDEAKYEAELRDLPKHYGPPRNELLVAELRGDVVGCVALKSLSEEDCEMKRMFVRLGLHGHGIGRALGEAVVAKAKALGYARMLLDTSVRQSEAQALYRKLGFREIKPYYDLPEDLAEWLVFMELRLD